MERVEPLSLQQLQERGWTYHSDDGQVTLYYETFGIGEPGMVHDAEQHEPYFLRDGAGAANVRFETANFGMTRAEFLILDSESTNFVCEVYDEAGFFVVNIDGSIALNPVFTIQYDAMSLTAGDVFSTYYTLDNGNTWVQLGDERIEESGVWMHVSKGITGYDPGPNFGIRITAPASGQLFIDNILIRTSINPGFYTGDISKEFIEPVTGAVEVYTYNTPNLSSMAEVEAVMAMYATMVEYGVAAIKWSPDDMYFPKSELYQWISPQQLDQFEKMYPDCVIISYNSALGYVYSQIGELYDIPRILAGETTDGTSKIIRWILTVLTAYNLTSPSMKHSATLEDNYTMVVKKVTEMKNGATTLHNAPIKPERNAWPTIVNNSSKMLG